MHAYLIPSRSHDHYGPEVQEKLEIFQDLWKGYYNTTWLDLKENWIRLDAIQSAWDALAKARKAETGTGFYVTPEQYKNVHNR
jgi:hypothetical protein